MSQHSTGEQPHQVPVAFPPTPHRKGTATPSARVPTHAWSGVLSTASARRRGASPSGLARAPRARRPVAPRASGAKARDAEGRGRAGRARGARYKYWAAPPATQSAPHRRSAPSGTLSSACARRRRRRTAPFSPSSTSLSLTTTTTTMNGQLNGFHDAFIEEGTFLFTSESVGEGHSGEATGPGAKRGRVVGTGPGLDGPADGGSHTGCPRSPGGEKSGGCAPPSWRRRCPARVRRSPPPPFLSAPFLPPGRARSGVEKIPENEKGGGPWQLVLYPGRALFPPVRHPNSVQWASRPERARPALGSAPPALQPQPRVCRMWHLGRGSGRAAWAPAPRDAFSSVNSLAWVAPRGEDGLALRQYMVSPSRPPPPVNYSAR